MRNYTRLVQILTDRHDLLKNQLKKESRSPFLLNVGKIAGGSALSQIIAFICAPILTRLFLPDDFGLLGVFMAIGGVACTISTFGYDLAIMLPKDDSDAWDILCFAAKLPIISVIFVFCLLYPFRFSLADTLGTPGLAPYFVWLPLLVLGGGAINLITQWAVRKKNFGTISLSSVSSSLFGSAFKIGGGLLGFTGGWLIISTFLQQIIQLLTLSSVLKLDIYKRKYNHNNGKVIAKKNLDLPLFRMPQMTLSNLAWNLPNIILAFYFSPSIVGFYLLSYRVIFTPLNLFRQAVRVVFYQKASEIYHSNGNLYGNVIRMTIGLITLCLPVTLILWFAGDVIFQFVFGSEWSTSGIYAKYIGILVLASVANTPCVVIIPIINKNKTFLIFEILNTGSRLLAISISGHFLSAQSTIMIFCCISALNNLCLIFWILTLLKKHQRFTEKI